MLQQQPAAQMTSHEENDQQNNQFLNLNPLPIPPLQHPAGAGDGLPALAPAQERPPVITPDLDQPAPVQEHPEIIFSAALLRIRQYNPTYTAADFWRDYAIAQTRTDIRVSPLALVIYCAQRREPVYSQATYGRTRAPHALPDPTAPPPARPDRRRGTPRVVEPVMPPEYLRALDLRLSPEEQAALTAEVARAAAERAAGAMPEEGAQ